MKQSRRLLFLGAICLLHGCAVMPMSEFARGRPELDPTQYFTGHTRSVGVLENRGGAPTKKVTTETSGHWENGTLFLEQDLQIGAQPQHRSWRIRKVGPRQYEATANDLVGIARGEASGNVFHWTFTLELSPGNPLARVRMSQWMYLQPDGRALVNHSTVRKFGVVVAQVTEQFQKQ